MKETSHSSRIMYLAIAVVLLALNVSTIAADASVKP